MDGVIAKMEALGATVVRFELPEYDRLLPVIATDRFEAQHRDGTLLRRASARTRRSRASAQLVAAKTSAVQKTLETELAIADGMNSAEYKKRMLNRDKLRLAVANKMAESISTRSFIRIRRFWSCR